MKENIKNNVWEKRIKTRTDLTRFLVHLTKPNKSISNIKEDLLNKDDILELEDNIYKNSADVLINILNDGILKGNNSRNEKGQTPVVCFQDISFSVLKEIEKDLLKEYNYTKKLRYCGVGLSFDKSYLYKKQTRPVIYDTKSDFFRERLKKYTHLSPIKLKSKITDNKRKISMFKNAPYNQILYTLNNLDLEFIERLDTLSRDLSNNHTINKIKEEVIKIIKSLKDYNTSLNELKRKVENFPQENIANELIPMQINILKNLLADLEILANEKDYINVVRNSILNNLNEYMVKRCSKLEEDDFIWRFVELNLDGKYNDSGDINIVDFTFEREWRKKNKLEFHLEDFKNKLQDMVLIFPNRNIYEYFINKISYIQHLKFLLSIKEYNNLNDNKGVTYVILEDYIDYKSIESNNNLLEKLTISFKEKELINNEILDLLNSYKIR